MYSLDNYHLTNLEVFQSLFVSEYGLRHLKEAVEYPQYKLGHYLIALIELVPLLGQIVSLIEGLWARFFPPEWIFTGSQEGCHGVVNLKNTHRVFDQVVKTQEKGIHFNRAKIVNRLAGGGCSAMAFSFAARCQKIQKLSMKKLMQIGEEFKVCADEMRDQQMAFNTIEVQEVPDVDLTKNKVQSLANYYGLKFDGVTAHVDIEMTKEECRNRIRALPSGIYVVRYILPSKNEKLEENGHTMVYIKDPAVEAFYDPNYGLKNLADIGGWEIYTFVKSYNRSVNLTHARFYRLKAEV